jgi:glycerophosphoryl diester phosphodiesterase
VALVCAHRGFTRDAPENTAAAFEAAIRLGVDMVETDVRRSGDGELVLAHDPLDGAPAGGLCRLSELVRLARGRVALDVELKEAGFEREALSLLRPYPPGLVVTSFLDGCLEAVAAADPGVATGLLIAPDAAAGGWVERALAVGARYLAPHETILDSALRDACVAAGLGLIVWTVNEPGRLAALLADPAVHCVITDECRRAVELRRAAR